MSTSEDDMNDKILKIALAKVTAEFDAFISCCLDGDKLKKPKMGDIMKAKACMPKGAKNAFTK